MKGKFSEKVKVVKNEFWKVEYAAKRKAVETYSWVKNNVTLEDIAKFAAATGVVLKTVDKAGRMMDEHRSKHTYYDQSIKAYVKFKRQPNAREVEMIRQMHEEGYTYSECYRMLGLIK